MCTQIPNNHLEELLCWVIPINKKQIKIKEAALLFPGSKRILERWLSAL